MAALMLISLVRKQLRRRVRALSPLEQVTLRAIRGHYAQRCCATTYAEFSPMLGASEAQIATRAVRMLVMALVQGYRSAPSIAATAHWLMTDDEMRLLQCLRAIRHDNEALLEQTTATFVVNPLRLLFATGLVCLAESLDMVEQSEQSNLASVLPERTQDTLQPVYTI